MSYLSNLLGTAYKEGMTEDELSKALEALNLTTGNAGAGEDAEVARLKAALSKANSEAADYKKQLRSKQTEAEAAAAQQKEDYDKAMKENAELKRSIALSEKKAKLLGMGYDADLADKTAAAMVDGDMDTVLANQQTYLEAQKKSMTADQMRGTARPAAGAENGGMDYDKMIAEAQASGNISAAAYYTRLQAQEAAKQISD